MGKPAAIIQGRPVYEPPVALDMSEQGAEGQTRRTMGYCGPGTVPTGPNCSTGTGYTPGNCKSGSVPNAGNCTTGSFPTNTCLAGTTPQ